MQIVAFQNDHVFVAAGGRGPAPNPRATAGLIAPGDASWEQLCRNVTAGFENLRVLPAGRTVYIAATAAELNVKLAAAGRLVFTDLFAQRVANTINRMHRDHGVALGVCPQGDRRTFGAQYILRTSGRNVTNAGPGESNLNSAWRWISASRDCAGSTPMARWSRTRPTGCTSSIRQGRAAESNAFWAALRRSGEAIGAFRGPVGDRPHLQNWSDAGVSMAARLAALLTLSATMQWTGQRGGYSSDLGLGGELVPVGSAVAIWAREATVTSAELQRLRTAAARRPARPDGPPAPPPPPGARPPAPGTRPAAPAGRVTQEDVVTMQQELRRQFDLADANWRSWSPN